VVSISACHADDPGSIPGGGDDSFLVRLFEAICIAISQHKTLGRRQTIVVDHIKMNTPYPVRSAQLSVFESDEYSGGGPPGKFVMSTAFFLFLPSAQVICKSVAILSHYPAPSYFI
jgi:hypothetical protein